jgi:hypothetical protein
VKYTFICEDKAPNYPPTIKTHEIETVGLADVLSAFEDFLRGCGFHFDGHVQVVDDSADSVSEPDTLEF